MLTKEYPRPCVVESNQFHIEGLCLGINDGIALVECENGNVATYNLLGIYSLKFTDR